MGVQDFDQKVQETVGRIQGEKETADLVEAARAAGFKGVNLDLIYGLPYQTSDTWSGHAGADPRASTPTGWRSSASPTSPGPSRTRSCCRRRRCPRPSSGCELFLQTVEAFTGGGYRLIGLDHFALETDELARAQSAGTMFRNFQGYTVRPADDTVAFGMTSISDIGGAYAQNSAQAEGLGRPGRGRRASRWSAAPP